MKLLTKSKYMYGLQCPKLLWYSVNQPDVIPKPDESSLARMDEGTQVGVLATHLFPDGVSLANMEFTDNINKTKELLDSKNPLFEAGFMANGLFSRVDILKPNEDGSWDIIEVKSSTKVKPEHIQDVSFQKHTLELAGLKINKCFLCHVNTEYVRNEHLDVHQLFTLADITQDVEKEIQGIENRIQDMKDIISQPNCPAVSIGSHCTKPYACSMMHECWGFLPEQNVFELYRGGKKAEELFNQNIHAIKDIPEDFKLNTNQLIQRKCALTGECHVEPEKIKEFIEELDYPIHHFDFETIAPAVPQFSNMRPYQRMAFQYSLHVEHEDGTIEHKSFLSNAQGDCRNDLISSMKEHLNHQGSILVYYEPFEKSVIKELARDFPEIRPWADEILIRIKDLLVPFKTFSYYNPTQKGSASIKAILPALTDLSYKDLDIQNGEVASRLFKYIMFQNPSEEEKQQIRQQLEKYCERDTWAEVLILQKLKEFVK